MSRTDHHRPYWVRIHDPLERRFENHDHRGPLDSAELCDLEDFDVHPHVPNWQRQCTFDLGFVEVPCHRPAPGDAHVYYYGPDRARSREHTALCRALYRAATDSAAQAVAAGLDSVDALADLDFPEDGSQPHHRSAWWSGY